MIKTELEYDKAIEMCRDIFKKKLIDYCAYKEWTFNPDCLLLTANEKSRNDIRKKEKGQEKYYFYIDTMKSETLPVNLILNGVDSGGMEDPEQPIFGNE